MICIVCEPKDQLMIFLMRTNHGTSDACSLHVSKESRFEVVLSQIF